MSAAPGDAERALARAVLIDALGCAAGEIGTGPRQLALAAEARAWIASRDESWPFSFENLCQWLGVDAGAIRERVLALAAPTGASVARQRRTLRSARDARIRALHASGWSFQALAGEFRVTATRISQICTPRSPMAD